MLRRKAWPKHLVLLRWRQGEAAEDLGMTEEEIQSFPDLEHDDIREALHYAAKALRERELPMVKFG